VSITRNLDPHPDCQSANQNWLPQPLLYMQARLLICERSRKRSIQGKAGMCNP
jgi:hypothetical protein